MTTTTPTADRLLVRFDWTEDRRRVYRVMTDVDPEFDFVTEVRRFDSLLEAAAYAMGHNQALHDLRALAYKMGGGFHPDTPGDDYTTLPEGVTAADIDRVIEAAVATDVDVYEVAYDVWADLEAERAEAMCGRSLTLGPSHDPYGTVCDLDRGHDGPHEGDHPLAGPDSDRIRWTGGGSAAADPLPHQIV